MVDFDLDRILENVPVPTFVIDTEHRVKYWNKACEELTSYNKEDIIGTADHWKPFFSRKKPLLADIILDGVGEFYNNKRVKKRKIREVRDREDTYELELFLPHFGRWVYFRASLLRSNGEVIGAIETMEDISERKLMEELVKAAEQEKGVVLDSMREVVIFQDLNHRVLLANRAAGETVNLDPDAMVGNYCYEMWFDGEGPCKDCPVERVYKTGYPQEAETRVNEKVLFIRGYPVKDEEGNTRGVVEVGLDITERKKMEENLTRLNQLLRISTEINDLIVKEKKKGELLKKACRTLARFDVNTVWTGLVEDGRIRPVEVMGEMNKEEIENILFSYCVQEAISTKKTLLRWSRESCGGCPIREKLKGYQIFIIPISYSNTLYGLICFCSSTDIFGEEERNKMKELSEDLGFALWSIEIEQERREAIDQITKNLEYFDSLADKLRNPLAIAMGYLELEDEIGTTDTIKVVANQIERLHSILNDLRKREKITFQLREKLD